MIYANYKFSEVTLIAALEFGNGDIMVTDGIGAKESGEHYAALMFHSSEPYPVGTEHEDFVGKTSNDVNPQVALFFDNVGSIDVVISKLMDARQNLPARNNQLKNRL